MATIRPPMPNGTLRVPLVRAALTLLMLSLLGWSFGAATAWAQRGGPRLSKADVMGILRGHNIPGGQLADFKEYFNKGFLTEFAAPSAPPDHFYRTRKELGIYLRTGRTGQAHDELNKMTLAKMVEIIRDSKTDNAAKINAIFVIGELNDIDEPGKGNPLPDSFRWLWAITKSPSFKDQFKVPAMAGIERFAAAGTIPAANKADVAKVMLALVKQNDPPAGHSPDGHYWMRRQAAGILAKIGGATPSPEVVNAIATIAADPTARPAMRCEMAQLIGQFKLTGAAKVDVGALANSLGHQAVELCTAELDKAEQEKRDPQLRSIMYALYSVREALAGLQAAAADTPHKKQVADLYSKVKTLHAELDDPELSTNSMASDVAKKIKELQDMLAPKAPVATQEVAAAAVQKKPVESAKQ